MKIIISAVAVFALLGCGGDTPKQTTSNTATTPKQTKPTGIKHTVAPVRKITGKSLYLKCAGCHGSDASKSALGKSKIIKGWSSVQIVSALEGYKNGTYGGNTKNLMQAQVKELNAIDIHIVSEYISKL